MLIHQIFQLLYGEKLARWVVRLFPAGLFTYSCLRAERMSLTHDECGSFAIWTDFDIFTCHYSAECWGTANLHWLYVLLMKPAIWLLGDSELVIRLPSLLAHLIYLYFSFQLVNLVLDKNWKSQPWSFLFGFILLNVNPYLLDFFSLARGYGLAIAMMMGSLYYFVRWIYEKRLLFLSLSLAGAFLAVLSNFTLLNYYACLVALIIGITGIHVLKERKISRPDLLSVPVILGISGLLFLLIHQPIGFLRKNGEFEWGAGSFWDTFHSLVKNSLYGGPVFKMYNVEILGGVFVLLLIAALIAALRCFLKDNTRPYHLLFLSAILFPLLISLASVIQHHLLGSEYLVNRTALLLIPLSSWIPFLYYIHLTGIKNCRQVCTGLALFIGIFCCVHLLRVGQTRFSSEWGYDHQTKKMLEYLDEKLPDDEKVKLGVHWLFHPSSTYYIKTIPYDFAAETLHYSKDLRLDGYYEYYYVQPQDVGLLDSLYILEKRFSWAGCLMKKKSP